MTIEEIKARLAEILAMLESPDYDEAQSEELLEEARSLRAQLTSREARAAEAAELRRHVAPDAIARINNQERRGAQTFTAASPEYRSAYLHRLQGIALTDAEQRAYTFMTSTTPDVLPTETMNRIIDLVSTQHPLAEDVDNLPSGVAITIPVAKTVVTGVDVANEGAPAPEIEITFDDVSLAGQDITAVVKITYQMRAMSIDAFENFLVDQIAEQYGQKKADIIATNIKTQMAAANKITGGVTFAKVTQAFGALKRTGALKVYCNNNTFYTKLVGMVNAQGTPIFQNPITADGSGFLLGAAVRIEDSLADGELLVGDPKKYVQNIVQGLTIEQDRDLESHKIIHSGYACEEGTLSDDKAFAHIAAQ